MDVLASQVLEHRPPALRDKYLAAEPAFSRLRLVDTHIEMAERMAEVIRRKALTLKLAIVSLAIAVLLVAVGLGLH